MKKFYLFKFSAVLFLAAFILLAPSFTRADISSAPVENDECSQMTLAPTESCIVSVAFLPTSGGGKQAKLTIPSDDPDESPVNVSLTGTGVPPCGDNPQITKLSKQTATFGDKLTITGSGFCVDEGTVVFSGNSGNIIRTLLIVS